MISVVSERSARERPPVDDEVAARLGLQRLHRWWQRRGGYDGFHPLSKRDRCHRGDGVTTSAQSSLEFKGRSVAVRQSSLEVWSGPSGKTARCMDLIPLRVRSFSRLRSACRRTTFQHRASATGSYSLRRLIRSSPSARPSQAHRPPLDPRRPSAKGLRRGLSGHPRH